MSGPVADAEMLAAEAQRARTVAALVADGQRVVGAKLAITTAAAQARAGADGQIHGWLTDAMELAPDAAHTDWTPGASRIEAELAVILGRDLAGPGVTAADVRDATAAVSPAFDLPALRPEGGGGGRLVVSMVANNANAGHFVLGPRLDVAAAEGVTARFTLVSGPGDGPGAGDVPGGGDVATGEVQLTPIFTAIGLLADELGAAGSLLPAGSIILTGALTAARELSPGTAVLALGDLGSVRLRIS